jgi:sugar/nucleoside kinase (ribokinase family)
MTWWFAAGGAAGAAAALAAARRGQRAALAAMRGISPSELPVSDLPSELRRAGHRIHFEEVEIMPAQKTRPQ